MKRIALLLLIPLTMGWSCSGGKETGGEPAPGNNDGGSEVELTLRTDAPTRADLIESADDKIVGSLDLLVFDSDGKFLCWRSAYRVNGNLRTTLPVGSGYDVQFLANCRTQLETFFPDQDALDAHTGVSEWDDLREALIDASPARLTQTASVYTPLPMWGTLTDQKVEDLVVNRWQPVYMIRSVASADVYVEEDVDNFVLEDAAVYFAANKGFLGTDPSNVEDNKAKSAMAPSDMLTSLTLETDAYDDTNLCIAHKLYFYDNDVTEGTATATKKHTRLVIGGLYKGTKYYYPIDFENADGTLRTIIRNQKYVFVIQSVTGPGYTDRDVAAEQPPVHLNVTVVAWDMNQPGDLGVSGPYYVWLEKKAVTLWRDTNFTVTVGVTSNVLAANISLDFTSDDNGDQTTIANGIENDHFRVEKVVDGSGNITGLLFSAIGPYDASHASDKVRLVAGRIEFEITITRRSDSPNDWEDGGGWDVDAGE